MTPNLSAKKRALAELARIARGDASAEDPIVREFQRCPQFQAAGRILHAALDRNRYGGRRRDTQPAPSLPPPFLMPG